MNDTTEINHKNKIACWPDERWPNDDQSSAVLCYAVRKYTCSLCRRTERCLAVVFVVVVSQLLYRISWMPANNLITVRNDALPFLFIVFVVPNIFSTNFNALSVNFATTRHIHFHTLQKYRWKKDSFLNFKVLLVCNSIHHYSSSIIRYFFPSHWCINMHKDIEFNDGWDTNGITTIWRHSLIQLFSSIFSLSSIRSSLCVFDWSMKLSTIY